MPRTLRDRGKELAGRKWVDENFDLKTEIRARFEGLVPPAPAFITSEFPGSDEWSDECPPEILFYLQPPPSKFVDLKLPYALDENANIIISPHKPGKGVRIIPTLPDQISLDVPGWQITAWRRLDPRISLQDILDRMTTDLGEAQKYTKKEAILPHRNSLANRCTRDCRRELRYYNGYGRRLEPHRAEIEAMEELTMNNILFNTTLEYHPKFERLIKVKFVRKAEGCKFYVEQMKVTEENLQETTFPLNHFLFEGYVPELTESMHEAIEMLWTLQERAVRHGINPSYWKKLQRSCLPTSWFDRTKAKTTPNGTYDGGCNVCTWTSDGDKAWKTVDFNKPPRRMPRPKKVEAGVDEDKESDSESEQSQPEEADDDSAVEDFDDMPAENFMSSPEKMIESHQKSPSTSFSPLKRQRASQEDPSPTPNKRRVAVPVDVSQAVAADDGLMQVGAWSMEDELDPYHPNYNHGYRDAGIAAMQQMIPAGTTYGYGYVESSADMNNQGYAAPYQIWNPSPNEALARNMFSAENLEPRLRSSHEGISERHDTEHDVSEAQLMSTTEHDQIINNYASSVLNDPTLAAPFEMDENDEDIAAMLVWCRTLTQNTDQPRQPDAAGVG